MLNLLTRLRPFIDRCPDEVVAWWASRGRSAAAEHPSGAYWQHCEAAGKARRDVLRLYVAQNKERCFAWLLVP
jgi:hypothetical protein